MDILAHALYGATLFSRTGLAGGTRGPIDAAGRPRSFDWTVWAAFAFALLPDVLSIGVEMITAAINDTFFSFARVPPHVLVIYKLTHTLIVAGAVCLLARTFWKPLFLPSLAWPLHTFLDVLTHGPGRFKTFIFFPISGLTFQGINWWTHPWVIVVYWSFLPMLWLGIHLWRRSTVESSKDSP